MASLSELRSEPSVQRVTRLPVRRPERPTVSVIVPAMNEAENLPHVLASIPGWVLEIIVVDGDSIDGTPDVARAARADVTVVHQFAPGKGNALLTGFEAASGDIIVTVDADGSADGAEISRFVEALQSGADFAKGSRFLDGGGSADITPLRRVGNAVLGKVANLLHGTRYTDFCYGYNAFWRRSLDQFQLDCSGFEVEAQMNCRAARGGLFVIEVPSFEANRIHGQSNLRTFRDGWRVLRTILAETRRPRQHREHELATLLALPESSSGR
jgi:glycosyltransferase involved in cell wall biosynthesis